MSKQIMVFGIGARNANENNAYQRSGAIFNKLLN